MMHCVRSQKTWENVKKNFCLICFFTLYWFIPVVYLVQTDLKFLRDKIIMIRNNIPNSLAKGHRDIKPDIKRNWKFSRWKNDGKGRMRPLLLLYFSDCKNKRIKPKTNLAASKMKLFGGISWQLIREAVK